MAIVNNTLIEVKGLSYHYAPDKEILSDTGCTIEAGKFTVVMGQNGSGKSTFLRILGGILPCREGSIKIKGKELNHMKVNERARHMGFLPQQHHSVFPFRVAEVVLTGRASYINYLPGKTDKYHADQALVMVGIAHLRNRIYTELSGGEQQLVRIARMLAQQPDILLMDEPVSHLDYNNQMHILKMIKQLIENEITVVAVLHDPNMAWLFGDKFIYVHQTKLHEIKPEQPWKHPLTDKIFHHEMEVIEYNGKHLCIPIL